jgi:soluble lytic murein transglycosylase-like protein
LKRRLYRAIVVGYFGWALLAGIVIDLCQQYAPDEIFEEEQIANDTINLEVFDIPRVSANLYEDRSVEIEEVVNVIEPYYDISNGYISEESLYTCCVYVGQQYDIDPILLMAFAKTESNYDIYAVGTSNDCGLCQIVPKWSKDRIAKLNITDIFDPIQNLTLCADILADYKQDRYGYDQRYVSMAYNMGCTKAKELYESGVVSSYAKHIQQNYDILRRKYE